MAKFVIINHSPADISGLTGNVTIWGRTQKSEEDAQGTFTFMTNLGPMESKEMSVPLNTKRKIYELGDWQNLTTDVQITAPRAARRASRQPLPHGRALTGFTAASGELREVLAGFGEGWIGAQGAFEIGAGGFGLPERQERHSAIVHVARVHGGQARGRVRTPPGRHRAGLR